MNPWMRTGAAVLLVFCLVFSFPMTETSAASVITIEDTYINPLYAGIVSQDELQQEPDTHRVLYSDPEYADTTEEAGAVLRAGMKARSETVKVCLKTETYDGNQETIKALMRDIGTAALRHTGVPTEGDYLMWQYGGWNCKASGTTDDSGYYWTFTYTITYYTTAEQEEEMDEAVTSLLDQLDLPGQTDYQKIRTIYDYICRHVSYDRSHLGDSSYKRQFTAYAALMDGTAVCQGYALLFSRLALETGIDTRLIPGVSHGENHGWNIVVLNDLYYNADTTWDSEKSEYEYFLKSQETFKDHTRDTEYDTDVFHSAYPMSGTDYVPTHADTCSHSYEYQTETPAGCLEDGVKTGTCTLCGYTYQDTIPAEGHSYTSTQTAPTCTEAGSVTYTCAICSHSYREDIPATGHSWDEGTLTKEPTVSEEGTMTYTCSLCGAKKSTTIPKLDTPSLDGVYRLSGKDRYKTAFLAADMLKVQLGIDHFNCVVIASGTNFADALSGSYLASQKQAPILLAGSDNVEELTAYLETNLAEAAVVYILGGTAAVPGTVDDALMDQGYTLRRLSGRTRYDTNLKILQEAGVGEKDILVCTGVSFADSLSASALNLPILLVDRTLTDSQRQFLESLNGNDLTIIGGSGAVSQDMALALNDYGAVSRISGKNRFATSIRVAETFFTDIPDNIVLAYGHNFPDGLCGGVLAYFLNAPLILTQDADAGLAEAYASELGITTGAVLGGTKLISDETVKAIFQMDSTDSILKP